MSLSEVMKKKKVKTKDLAERLNINVRTLENYRSNRNKLTLEMGLEIARILEVDPHELLEKKD